MKRETANGTSWVVLEIVKAGGNGEMTLSKFFDSHIQCYLVSGYVARGMNVNFIGTNC